MPDQSADRKISKGRRRQHQRSSQGALLAARSDSAASSSVCDLPHPEASWLRRTFQRRTPSSAHFPALQAAAGQGLQAEHRYAVHFVSNHTGLQQHKPSQEVCPKRGSTTDGAMGCCTDVCWCAGPVACSGASAARPSLAPAAAAAAAVAAATLAPPTVAATHHRCCPRCCSFVLLQLSLQDPAGLLRCASGHLLLPLVRFGCRRLCRHQLCYRAGTVELLGCCYAFAQHRGACPDHLTDLWPAASDVKRFSVSSPPPSLAAAAAAAAAPKRHRSSPPRWSLCSSQCTWPRSTTPRRRASEGRINVLPPCAF